jgi:glycosyltransferase involved in cell wall biosynthesis
VGSHALATVDDAYTDFIDKTRIIENSNRENRASLGKERIYLMYEQPLVSVILIFLNAEKYIREAIDSVLVQTYECWELLLIDDGSIDKSTEIARSYVAQYPEKINYLEHPNHQNRGMSASRNLGIDYAKGDYIAFLDSDDYWLPNRLEVHVGILDSHPEVGLLYGSAKYWYGWTGRPEDRERDFVPQFRVRMNTRFDPPTLLPLLLDGKAEVPCTCSILVRKEVMQKVGGFEESFRGMYEDQAFYAKISLSAPVLATGDSLAWYRQHPTSHSAIMIRSGALFSTQYTFLKWLEKYCSDRGIHDEAVLRMIRRKLWLSQNASRGYFSALSPGTVRWFKKWILRLEEHILPSKVRSRLWLRR